MSCDDALDLKCVCLAPHHGYQSNKFKDILRRILRLDINLFNTGRILSTASRIRQCIQCPKLPVPLPQRSDKDRLRLAFLFDYCFEAGHRPPTSRQRRLLLDAAWWRSWVNPMVRVLCFSYERTGCHGFLSASWKCDKITLIMSSYVDLCHFSGRKKLRPEWQNVTPYPRKLASFASAVPVKMTEYCSTNLAN